MDYAVQVITDSITAAGRRLTTITATYPRFIHSELLTHRDRARNAASSRAIPWQKMKEMIAATPVIPLAWGAEQSGMQAGDQIPERMHDLAKQLWLDACENALFYADQLANIGRTFTERFPLLAEPGDEKIRIHKSIPNRITEPWMWITVVMSATEWQNFFRLRCHPDAEIHFQKIAGMIREALDKSTPDFRNPGEWHLPFIQEDERQSIDNIDTLAKISTARCARVSYLTHDGRRSIEADLQLFDRLCQGSGFGHWCYDHNTEVLTDRGWMYWDDAFHHKPQLAAADPNAGTIQFEKPSAWYGAPYTGKMYSLKGQGLDLLVTPNHQLVVSTRKSGGAWTEYRKESAEKVFGKPVRHCRSAHLINNQRSRTENPWGYKERDFAALVGFFCGDGSAEYGSANAIYFNLRLPHKIEYLLSIEPAADCLRSGKWAVRGEGIANWFYSNCYTKNGEKKLPDSFRMATNSEFVGLMSGLRYSDGSAKGKTWHYDTTSVQLAGDIQSLLHINGLAAGWSVRKSTNPAHKDCIRIHVSERISPRVETNCGRSKTFTEQWVWHEGAVYCATVSTGALMVRRNGVVCISGNSPHEHVAYASHRDHRSGPFVGWGQYRKMFSNENLPG